jgi:hypothetical protein
MNEEVFKNIYELKPFNQVEWAMIMAKYGELYVDFEAYFSTLPFKDKRLIYNKGKNTLYVPDRCNIL